MPPTSDIGDLYSVWWKQGRTEVWIEIPYGKKSIFHKYKKFQKSDHCSFWRFFSKIYALSKFVAFYQFVSVSALEIHLWNILFDDSLVFWKYPWSTSNDLPTYDKYIMASKEIFLNGYLWFFLFLHLQTCLPQKEFF